MQTFSPHKLVRGALFILLCSLALAWLAACRRSALPGNTSSEYTEAVRAFYTGLAALQVGDDARAESKLRDVTRLAPDEPAGWADLGLLYLRQRELERAAENLEKAEKLAPESAAIRALRGLLESNRGNYTESVAQLRRAVELDPKDLKSLYALASEVEREGGEAGETETITLLNRILDAQPGNLAVELDLARLAAKRGDADALRRSVARLAEKSTSWPPEVQEQLKTLQAAASGEQVRIAAPRVQFLRNVLVRVPEYRQSLAAVKLPPEIVGEPIARPLRLEAPAPAPAAPDEALAFGVEPVAQSGAGRWMWAGAVSLTGEGSPVAVLASEREVQVGTAAHLPCTLPEVASQPVAALDFDYDFKMDLALACRDGLKLFKQAEGGAFADVTARAAFPSSVRSGTRTRLWAFDIEADGDLDLIAGGDEAGTIVLQNNGDGTFKELPTFAGAFGLQQFVWGDIDADGDADVAMLVSGGQRAMKVFMNERGGQFRERALPENFPAPAGLGTGDADNDGRPDLLTVHADGSVRLLSDYEDGRGWSVSGLAQWPQPPADVASAPLRIFFADLDNNGGLDLLATGGGAVVSFAQVWLADAGRTYKPQASVPLSVSTVADLNGDGRLDLLGLGAGAAPARALNRGAKNYHWQVIRPRAQEATGDQRINSFGIGGEIEIRAGLLTQKQLITSAVVHFGLGEQGQTDVARITWPNGVLQAEFELRADTVALAEQRLKGSCPWVFAFDGEQVRFVTDTLWRSPLGLKINAQDTAGVMMTEEWVKIRGDQLRERGGFYDIRITAELWETHFFDHVSLMVVDHPAQSDLFVDERFAVPPPALKLHATARPRPFAVALDDDGHDVSNVVGEADGRYLDNFGRGAYQGVTREHFVELELPGDAPRDGTLWLVATGWIHPTDSSINVAISQGGQPKPQGLSLEVADGRGGWTTAAPALGFPAGKNKNVLVDLAHVFQDGAPRRLRLKTNLEIFWDKLAWASAETDAGLATQRLSPDAAELRYRGFSVVTQADKSSPELPDYTRLAATVPRWRDLVGYYTRFGDVRELLTSVDDRYVILNAGDEMLFRFAAPPAPPAGIVRDFVLVCDGWEKDGDYNTGFSKTVLPLPTHASAAYTTAPARLEDDPVYRRHAEDWQQYHTRYVTPQSFHHALRLR